MAAGDILRGDQGKFTPTSLNATLTGLIIDKWEGVSPRGPAARVRQFGSILPTTVLANKDFRGRFRAYAIDGTTPPIPADQTMNAHGTLFLGTKSTGSGYLFKAVIASVAGAADASGGGVQEFNYEFYASADLGTLSDTITVTSA